MEYIEVRINQALSAYQAELLINNLTEIGFEGFMEEEGSLTAYIPFGDFSAENLNKALGQFIQDPDSAVSLKRIPDQNWNALWESNFEPLVIAGQCYVRAPFHPARTDVTLEIIIEPKMSFGTAHHETTAMMMELLLSLDFRDKSILDMGCGTSILAILAAKRGASEIDAIDNDEWAYRNSLENIQINNTPGIKVILGDAADIPGRTYDIIIANINRNILLRDIPHYIKHMHTGSLLLLSGFYTGDMDKLKSLAEELSLRFNRYLTQNDWIAMEFVR
jgi:ribosomal protein L11 methyltransferase